MNTDNLPETLRDAIKYFGSLTRCHDFLVAMRWPDNIVKCPRCNSDKIGKLSMPRRVWNCKGCKKQFTVKVGTIFEDSPLGLDKWLPAVWTIINAKNGVSSCELHRALGVTQKTAWFMLHRIRLATQDGSMMRLGGNGGVVEVDETFIGGLSRNMHKSRRLKTIKGTGGAGKTAVQGLLDRKGKGCSKVIARVVRNVQAQTVQGNVRKYVLKGTNVMTDAASGYNHLGTSGDYQHEVIDHAVAYVRGHVHTNGMENFWALLKRAIKGTYVSVEPFHLFRYLDEQAFRYNERKNEDGDRGRFLEAIKGVFGKGLRYSKLIGKDEDGGFLPTGQGQAA